MEAVGLNDVWAMDFVHDQLATGRKLRVLTMVDTFSRYVPILDVLFSYRGEDVVNSLDQVCAKKSAIPTPFALITGQNLSHGIWICGPIIVALYWTSPGQESQPIMPSLRPSTVSSVRSA